MTSNSAGVTTAFVDLATFDELAAFLYGGSEAITYFVLAVQKSNWFSHLPAILKHVSGTANFDSEFSASVNRSGDYVLSVWFQAQVPQITLVNIGVAAGANQVYQNCAIRFCRNFMHNLVERATITFNELTVEEMDSTWFDIYKVYQVPEDKQAGYNNMIADIPSYFNWLHVADTDATNAQFYNVALGDGGYHALVLPFWFFMDSGVALMVAGLPFNDIKINFTLRAIERLILLDQGTVAGGGVVPATYGHLRVANINTAATGGVGDVCVAVGSATISLVNPQTWATYAIVHNDERVKIGKAPRDVLIQQVQRVADRDLDSVAAATTSIDLRLSHQIIALFWMAALNYHPASHSEYSTNPWYAVNYIATTTPIVPGVIEAGVDPISQTDIVYENTTRVSQFSHYYSIIDPMFFSIRIPDETGYHMKSYSLAAFEYQPKGSTGFSKLANVSLIHTASIGATRAAAGTARGINFADNAFSTGAILASPNGNGNLVNATHAPNDNLMQWRLKHRALNWNIGRMSGGSFGLPVL
jgi:hypothetical protein